MADLSTSTQFTGKFLGDLWSQNHLGVSLNGLRGGMLVSGCGLICKTSPIDKAPAVQETIFQRLAELN